MNTDNKNIVQETSRWLRVGTLTLTVLGPIISTLMARARERVDTTVKKNSVFADSQERLMTVGTALADLLAELKDRPYSQELLKRGEDLTEELMERGSKLSQVVVERGGLVTQEMADRSSELARELAKRGSELKQELAERSNRATQDLAKRSEQATKELNKRSRQVVSELGERNGTFWTLFGFGVGLIAAAVAAYLFLRRRMQQQDIEEDQPIELSHNGRMNKAAPIGQVTGNPLPTSQDKPITQTRPAIAVVEPQTAGQALHSAPVDARFVGVVSTKRYYPVETPLDQLTPSGDEGMDVIYFNSEEEAQAEGFSVVQ